MKILVITPYPPFPPLSGGRKRIWLEMQRLSETHDVDLLSIVYTREEMHLSIDVSGICENYYPIQYNSSGNNGPYLSSGLPEPVSKICCGELFNLAERLRDNYDIVICMHIFVAPVGLIFGGKKIIEEHNIESSILKRQLVRGDNLDYAQERFEAESLARFETATWGAFDLRIVVSERDRNYINSVCPRMRTEIVENGVDLGEISPSFKVGGQVILFLGTMNYFPNIEAVEYFCHDIFPLIRLDLPDAQFWIAGASPGERVIALTSIEGVSVVPDPESMTEIACQASISVVPLRNGGGTRIKILESFALGLPVVSTSIGAEGLCVGANEILIADSAEDFARCSINVLRDLSCSERLRRGGLDFVRERHDSRKILSSYEEKVLSVLNNY